MKDMLGREELCSLYDAREALLKSSAGSCFPKEIEIDTDNYDTADMGKIVYPVSF